MGINNCNCRCRCVIAALIAAAVIGVIAAFLQITAAIAVTPAFAWAAFGIAVVYLAVLLVAAARRTEPARCLCAGLNTALAGSLGTALLAVVLLTVDITAISVIGAILVGALLFFLTLTLGGTACLVRSLSACDA